MAKKALGIRWQTIIALDQLANTMLGGWADETISARCWRLRHEPKWGRARKVVDFIFGKDHCQQSFEAECLQMQMPVEERK